MLANTNRHTADLFGHSQTQEKQTNHSTSMMTVLSVYTDGAVLDSTFLWRNPSVSYKVFQTVSGEGLLETLFSLHVWPLAFQILW